VTFSVTVETVLYGHEGWVYGIHWHPKVLDASGTSRQPMKLLTASMDKTMIIWQPDADTGTYDNTRGSLCSCNQVWDVRTILLTLKSARKYYRHI